MGWEDRPYYRQGNQTGGNWLTWLMTGSVPLFTAFGIRVRAHAQLVVLCVLILLFGMGFGDSVAGRVQQVTALFAVILLHEFGHCFAARWVGGDANEILMTPLGGLAMTMAPRRPWATFVTVAGGPAVNVVICLVCGLGLYLTIGLWPFGPKVFGQAVERADDGLLQLAGYLFWIYGISYALLLFNLLPVFPLDGGQLLQSILWKPMGYYKSMMVTMNVGLVGSVLMIMWGIAMWGSMFGGLLVIIIGISCLLTCYRTRQMLRAEGPWAFGDEDSMDYGAYAASTFRDDKPKRRGPGWFAARRAERAAKEEAGEQERIDAILAKVSAHGMNSLTWGEKRALCKATENQKKRDLETQRRVRR